MKKTIRKYSVSLVAEGKVPYPVDALLDNQITAANVLWADLNTKDREYFIVLTLNHRHRINGYHTVAIGNLSAAIVTPPEVFLPALLDRASAIIVGHNHPSGSPEPSKQDRKITTRLCDAGKLLGVPVLDHIIVGSGQESLHFYSFNQEGHIPQWT